MLDSPTTIDHVLAISLALVSPWFDVALYPCLARATQAGRPRARTIAYLCYMAFEWGAALLVAWLWSGEARSSGTLGLRWASPSRNLIGLALVLAVLVVRARARAASSPERLARIRQAFGRAEPLLPRTGVERALFAALSITAGCVEEFLYRGYIFWYVEALCGTALALVVSSILFGLAHLYLGTAHFVRATLIGLLLGVVVLLSGSLWPAMAIHAMMDLFAGDLGWRAFGQSQIVAENDGRERAA